MEFAYANDSTVSWQDEIGWIGEEFDAGARSLYTRMRCVAHLKAHVSLAS